MGEHTAGSGPVVPVWFRQFLLASMLITGAAITLGPLPVGLLDGAHAAARTMLRPLPFVPEGHPRRVEVEMGLNLLVPALIAATARWALPTSRPWRILAIGFAASLMIEIVQVTIAGRYSHLRDVLLNTLGVAVGLLVAEVTCAAGRTVER